MLKKLFDLILLKFVQSLVNFDAPSRDYRHVGLQVEHIVIHAFASGSQTSTFRVTKLSEEFKVTFLSCHRTLIFFNHYAAVSSLEGALRLTCAKFASIWQFQLSVPQYM
jgi:hypothetical protein